MILSLKALDWFNHSILFFRKHFIVIFGLGLVAAFGRTIQLGAFGQIDALTNTILEVIVALVRIAIFLYALGLSNLKTGVLSVSQLFINKANRKQNWHITLEKLRRRWFVLLLNMIAFLVIASIINFLIDHIAYRTCLLYVLKINKIIADTASQWVLLLFFKNITVIPFTLIFNALFFLWITNRLNPST